MPNRLALIGNTKVSEISIVEPLVWITDPAQSCFGQRFIKIQ